MDKYDVLYYRIQQNLRAKPAKKPKTICPDVRNQIIPPNQLREQRNEILYRLCTL